MSSEPMKMLSRWDQVRCTSNQMMMTEPDGDASTRAAYHCKRSGSLPLQALGRPTWLSSSVSMSSSLDLSSMTPVRLCLWLSNSIPAQVVSSSFSVFSMLSSFVALSTMLRTSSSKLCRFRASWSARFVSSDITNFTWKG